MDLQETIEIIERDINIIHSLDSGRGINELIDAALSARKLDNDHLADTVLSIYDLQQYFHQSGNLTKVLDTPDLLDTAEVLIWMFQQPWLKNPDTDNTYIAFAFCVLYRHFEYGNELEKGLAAVEIINLLRKFTDPMTAIAEEFQDLAYDTPSLRKNINEEDFHYEPYFLLVQIQFSMIPFICHLHAMFPYMKQEEIYEHFKKIEGFMADFNISVKKILQKANLLCNFIFETKMKQYEKASEELQS
jgi:hypothetical protein